MLINWSKKNENYYGIVPESYDIILAIQEQVSKTLDIAQLKKGWDCVLFDIWMYTDCRLIATIQDKSQSIGTRSDFNVTLQLNQISNVLKRTSAKEYSSVLNNTKTEMINKIKIAFQEEDFLMSFDELWLKNPFVIRFCIEGVLQKIELQFGK